MFILRTVDQQKQEVYRSLIRFLQLAARRSEDPVERIALSQVEVEISEKLKGYEEVPA